MATDPAQTLRKAIEGAEAAIQEILQAQPRAGEEATLYGLRGKTIRAARANLETLLYEERIRSGVDQPSIYGERIIEACQAAKSVLENGYLSAGSKERVPKVIERLVGVSSTIEKARQAVTDAREQESEEAAKRWPTNGARSLESKQWGEIIGYALDLLDNFGLPAPEWASVGREQLVVELSRLDQQQPDLQLQKTVINPLEADQLQKAWIGLVQLAQEFVSGKRSL